jgi:hypothetical protein
MQTTMNGQVNEVLDRAGRSVSVPRTWHDGPFTTTRGPSLRLLAAYSILAAGDALEAVNPVAPHPVGVDPVPDGACRVPVRVAVCEPASIPQGHQPEGPSLALVHLADADHEVGGRICS